MTVPVYLESGAKRVFACAVDWPGWCRSGGDPDTALTALRAAGPRYAPIAVAAGVRFQVDADLEVVERLKGNATTDFGAPGAIRKTDTDRLTAAQAKRLEAERAYAGRLDLRSGSVDPLDRAAVTAFRASMSAALLKEPAEPARWPRRYAARRIGWHVLDHAWEIADRVEPPA